MSALSPKMKMASELRRAQQRQMAEDGKEASPQASPVAAAAAAAAPSWSRSAAKIADESVALASAPVSVSVSVPMNVPPPPIKKATSFWESAQDSSPRRAQKQANIIILSELPPSVAEKLRHLDLDGDGYLDVNEITALDEKEAEETKTINRQRTFIILILVCWILQVVAVFGVSFGASSLATPWSIGMSGVMTNKVTGQPVQAASTDTCVVEGSMVTRNKDGTCPTDGSNQLSVKPTAIQSELTSDLPDEFFKSVVSVNFESPMGNLVHVNVYGFMRNGTDRSVMLYTTGGHVFVTDDALYFKDTTADKIFERAGITDHLNSTFGTNRRLQSSAGSVVSTAPAPPKAVPTRAPTPLPTLKPSPVPSAKPTTAKPTVWVGDAATTSSGIWTFIDNSCVATFGQRNPCKASQCASGLKDHYCSCTAPGTLPKAAACTTCPIGDTVIGFKCPGDGAYYIGSLLPSVPLSYYPATTTSASLPITKGRLVDTIQLPAMYKISFNIYPTANTVAGQDYSIIHLTASGSDYDSAGSRIPGVWFSKATPSQTLYLSFINTDDWKLSEVKLTSTAGLPLSQWSTVTIVVDATNLLVSMSVSGAVNLPTQTAAIPVPQQLTWPSVQVYASDPWWDAAPAKVRYLAIEAYVPPPKPTQQPTAPSSRPTPRKEFPKCTLPWKSYTCTATQAPNPVANAKAPVVITLSWFPDCVGQLWFNSNWLADDARNPYTFTPENVRPGVPVSISLLGANDWACDFSGVDAIMSPPTYAPSASPTGLSLPTSLGVSGYAIMPIVKNNLLGYVSLPERYSIQLDLQPNADPALVSAQNIWRNIIHLAARDSNVNDIRIAGSRLTFLEFCAANRNSASCPSLGLAMSYAGSNNNWKWVGTSQALPIGSYSTVIMGIDQISKVGSLTVRTTSNGAGGINIPTISFTFSTPLQTTWPSVVVYASNPWYTAANADIKNLNIMAGAPTMSPTASPTSRPPSAVPTRNPSVQPTRRPTLIPTANPSRRPSAGPSTPPTRPPTARPSVRLTPSPSALPTTRPTRAPSAMPTKAPSASPTTRPTAIPTAVPTAGPTVVVAAPTAIPTASPTAPSAAPSAIPTPAAPTALPSVAPSAQPTVEPTALPSALPTVEPSALPTIEPSSLPTAEPTTEPSPLPSAEPTLAPSATPSAEPTLEPTEPPSAVPTPWPSSLPTAEPTTMTPTSNPTQEPTMEPSPYPSMEPTVAPIPIGFAEQENHCPPSLGIVLSCSFGRYQSCFPNGAAFPACMTCPPQSPNGNTTFLCPGDGKLYQLNAMPTQRPTASPAPTRPQGQSNIMLIASEPAAGVLMTENTAERWNLAVIPSLAQTYTINFDIKLTQNVTGYANIMRLSNSGYLEPGSTSAAAASIPGMSRFSIPAIFVCDPAGGSMLELGRKKPAPNACGIGTSGISGCSQNKIVVLYTTSTSCSAFPTDKTHSANNLVSANALKLNQWTKVSITVDLTAAAIAAANGGYGTITMTTTNLVTNAISAASSKPYKLGGSAPSAPLLTNVIVYGADPMFGAPPGAWVRNMNIQNGLNAAGTLSAVPTNLPTPEPSGLSRAPTAASCVFTPASMFSCLAQQVGSAVVLSWWPNCAGTIFQSPPPPLPGSTQTSSAVALSIRANPAVVNNIVVLPGNPAPVWSLVDSSGHLKCQFQYAM